MSCSTEKPHYFGEALFHIVFILWKRGKFVLTLPRKLSLIAESETFEELKIVLAFIAVAESHHGNIIERTDIETVENRFDIKLPKPDRLGRLPWENGFERTT